MKKLQLKKEIVESLAIDRTTRIQGGIVPLKTTPPECELTDLCDKPIDTLNGCVYTYGCKSLPEVCM